jgi:hypothetical protein
VNGNDNGNRIRTNARAGRCNECGREVPEGTGRLWGRPGAADDDQLVTHLSASHCAAQARAETRAEIDRSATSWRRAAEEIRAEFDGRIAAEGLVLVPSECVRNHEAERVDVEDDSDEAIEAAKARQVYHRGLQYQTTDGQRRWVTAHVRRVEQGLWACWWDDHFYPTTHYASAAIVEALASIVEARASRSRVCRWWDPETHSADSYPGPGVPEAELTDAEGAQVSVYRAARADASRRAAVEIRAEFDGWIAAEGLVLVSSECVRIHELNRAQSVYERSTSHETTDGQQSWLSAGVVREADGLWAEWREGFRLTTHYASPALAARTRVCRWWNPAEDPPGTYPGPGVPEAELTDAERAWVAVYRADAWRATRMYDIAAAVAESKEFARVLVIGGVTYEIEYGEGFDAWLAARSSDVTITVRVTLPTDCYEADGRLKATVARKIPAGPAALFFDVSAAIKVVRAGAE